MPHTKTLSEILKLVRIRTKYGERNPDIIGLTYDSRKVKPGYLFFALPGLHMNGAQFIPQAIKNGAVAIVHQDILESFDPSIAYIQVPDARLSMSPIAAAFYEHPSSKMITIGVTGTEGKSTTAYLIYQMLNMSGHKAGFFSTVMSDTGTGEVPNSEHQTTPEAPVVQQMLAEMVANGCEFAVVEASSHGLSKKLGRLTHIQFDIAIMTNVTHEHLEFHGTFEQYRSDKANLFRSLDKLNSISRDGTIVHLKTVLGTKRRIPAAGIINANDPSASYFSSITTAPILGYAVNLPNAQDSMYFYTENIRPDTDGVVFDLIECPADEYSKVALRIKHPDLRINLPGTFNLGNVMATLLAVMQVTGCNSEDFFPYIPQLKPVKGRMTVINKNQPFEVIVDYAHTPSSFEAVFPPLRSRVKNREQPGRVISVFGSGGERDTKKRPQQGTIAAANSDIVILTDEDPRGEDPVQLLEEIATGCSSLTRNESLFIISDRPAAIRKAIALAQPGDIVLLLGKGHENSIIYKDFTMPYDEITEAEKALAEAGWA